MNVVNYHALFLFIFSSLVASTVYDTDVLQLCVSSYSPKMATTLASDSESFAILLSLVMTEGETGTQHMAIQQVGLEGEILNCSCLAGACSG